jgi:hypothetical protein
MLRKERNNTKEEYHNKITNLSEWSSLLPKELLSYNWHSIDISNYSKFKSTISFTTNKDDLMNGAVATAWLTSLFNKVDIEKLQMNRWNTMPYIRASATLSNDREFNIYIYLHKTGECKKVKIIKEVPEEVTEAHREEEFAIICAGEELPDGAEIISEE